MNTNSYGGSRLKSFVIVSQGPVPSTSKTLVEGGGLRVWSLAEGLRSHGHNVRIAVPRSHFTTSRGGVFPYSDVQDIVDEVSPNDTVIANYAHNISGAIFAQVPKNVTRIADAYVPIHVEVSARDEITDAQIVSTFNNTSEVWLDALSRSDAILVASKEQKIYYTGVLFTLKKINPSNYRDAPILIAPLGVRSALPRPKRKDRVRDQPLSILWWGGFYPWFDFQALPIIAEELRVLDPNAKLKIAGAVNPFVNEKSFSDPAEKVLAKLRKFDNVEFLPWVPFSKRFSIFNDADVVLSLNKMGPETTLSWRTRYVDILEQAMPIATNGGDPFGELLLTRGGGIRLEGEPKDFARQIVENADSGGLVEMSRSLANSQHELTWVSATKALSDLVQNPDAVYLATPTENQPTNPKSGRKPTFMLFGPKPVLMLLDHIRRFGLRSAVHKSATVAWTIARSWLRILPKTLGARKISGPLVLLHQLDRSGAPLVGIDIAREFQRQSKNVTTILVANIKDFAMLEELKHEGFQVLEWNSHSHLPRFTSQHVLMNSSAIPRKWILDVLGKLGGERLKSATLFVHENEPQHFLDEDMASRLRKAQDSGLEILAESKQQRANIGRLYGLGLQTKLQRLSIDPAPPRDARTKVNAIDIILVGPTGDNRKRQLDTVAAVSMAQQAIGGNKRFRKISLTLVGVGENPLGWEIKRIGNQSLNSGTFRSLGPMDLDQCLIELGNANTVVSLSDNEAFGLYIAQAMTQGAVVLRTPVGGHDETVIEGVNGFLIKNGIHDLASRIVQLADRKLTSDSRLLSLMQESKAIIAPFVNIGYDSLVRRLLKRK